MNTSRLLIVEDESIVALDIQARLLQMGYEVIGIVDSGEDAIDMAAEGKPDLVLMDIRLRGRMDGVEAAQQIRARFGIPVVFLTAYADELTLQRAKIAEPLGYLIKPFEERELRSTLEMALHKIEMDTRTRVQTERLRRIVSTVPEGVALLDSDWRIVLSNTKAQEYLYDLEGVIVGSTIHTLGNHPIERLKSREDDRTWHEINLDDVVPRVFEARLSPLATGANTLVEEPTEWVLVIREVTEERQIQQRIQLQDRLAVIGQFAAGIAHDFNNILASIILEPYLIRKLEPNLSPRGYERLDGIAQQAKRASGLIRQILDFSRMSTADMSCFDILPLVKEITKMLDRMLPRNIHLELVFAPDNYSLQGDPNRIVQMLMNLTLNARDAMPKGGTLSIELARASGQELAIKGVSSDRQWLLIRVRDEGTGIQPEVLPHIFEPFFTTKAVGQGTGLGLAQVYGIVQQHEGHVFVESRPGSGATFSVYLPALGLASANGNSSGESRIMPVRGNQQTILVVEDNSAARRSICGILEYANYHVLTAANGREALAILDHPENGVDLILSDLDMPEMDGLEMCRQLRARRINVHMIILSGYISDDVITELRSLTVAEYMSKPVDADQLLELVESSWHMPPLR